MGRFTLARTLPSLTTIKPPCILITSFTANAISSSVTPTTNILWSSCAILVATAPFLRQKELINPVVHLPSGLYLSITAIFNISFFKSLKTLPSSTSSSAFINSDVI